MAETNQASVRAPLCLLGGCALVWWVRVGLGSGTLIHPFANFDALMYWLPLLREAAAQWQRGSLPLWNPYQALGTPLLATLQAGSAYPLNALYLVVDPGWSWLISAVIHQAIAGAGMYALCRRLDLSPPAAVVGAASYTFSFVALPKLFDQPQFICLAWLPVMFACAEGLLCAPTVSAVVRLGLVWALQILGGHPETIAQSALLLGAYSGVRVLSLRTRSSRDAFAAVTASGIAALLALALTAFQWLPTYELVQRSVRAVGALTAVQQTMASADPWQLLSGAPGRAPLVIAVIGVLMWRQRTLAWFFAGAAVLVALLAGGPATPLFDAFRHLPTGTWFRAPTRLLNVWPLCTAVLIAAGAEQFILPTNARRTRMIALSACLMVGARLLLTRRADILRALALVAAFDVLPMLLLAAVAQPAVRRRGTLARYANPFVILALFSAAPAAVKFNAPEHYSPRRIAELYAPHAAVFDELRRDAPARVLSLLPVANGHVWAKLGTYFETPVLNDLEPLTTADFQTFVAALSGTNPLWSLAVFMGEVTPPLPRFDARLLNLSGVRFVVTDTQTEPQLAGWFPRGLQLVRRSQVGGDVVYENPTAMPRAFFIAAGNTHPSGSDCVATLRNVGFDPAGSLLLDEPPTVSASSPATPPASVQISEYAPADIRLQVTSIEAGFVVLTDAFYPGWQAAVDGVAVPLRRADCFFRAVRIDAGSHVVTFRYAPQSLTLGLSISLASALLVGGALLAVRQRPATV